MNGKSDEERANFEAGDEPIKVKRQPRSGTVISVRISPEEADRLYEVAESRGKTVSQIAREAIGNYVNSSVSSPPNAALQVMVTGTALSNFVVSSGAPNIQTRGSVAEPAVHSHP